MQFKKLFNIFDVDYELSEVLDRIADSKNESRKLLNNHIRGLGKNGLKVEEKINELLIDHASVSFVAGFVMGQQFNITDPEALKEMKFLEKKMADVLGCWPRKKAPEEPDKEATGASKQE
jgi:hypothetical protein